MLRDGNGCYDRYVFEAFVMHFFRFLLALLTLAPSVAAAQVVMTVEGIAGHSQDFGDEKKSLIESRNEVPAAIETANAADAQTVVRRVIALDRGDWRKLFATKPTPLMKKFFSPGFNASWANAMTHNGEEPVLDGDPITGWQSVTSIVIQSLEPARHVDRTTVLIVAHLSVRTDGETKPEAVTFTLKRESDVMRIDDIVDPNMPSIRAYFRKSYGQ